MQNQDINQQIDRILSSNIRDELLSHISLDFLQSPCIQKAQKLNQLSFSINGSFSRQEFDEDLHEKAQQILKLKQTLESELANINQIVQDNQKLTEANLYLNSELKKIKAEWINFRKEVIHELKEKQNEMYNLQTLSKKWLHQLESKVQRKRNKMSIFTLDQIEKISQKLQEQVKSKNFGLHINSNIIRETISQIKVFHNQSCQTIPTTEKIQNTNNQIVNLRSEIEILNQQNIGLRNQIQSFGSHNIKFNQLDSNILRQKYSNSQQILCYESVFLKSVFSQTESPDEVIRTILFKSKKSLFEQLQESKYFGKIVLGKKNGNALQQYKNGFHYEGIFSRNCRHGVGRLYYKDKTLYAGQWREGKFSGKGILFYHLNLNVQKIQGNLKDGRLEGNATITFKSGFKLRTFFRKDQISSQGMILVNENLKLQTLQKRSYLGTIQHLKNKDKLKENDEIIFKTLQQKVIQIC